MSDYIEAAKKAGYIQGICECIAAIAAIVDNYAFCKKILTEMNITKDFAKEYANAETFKTLDTCIFSQDQKTEYKPFPKPRWKIKNFSLIQLLKE